jgi:lipopolysaccharide transport system ATP-binding protein
MRAVAERFGRDSPPAPETVVSARSVSRKFCGDLRRALRYGVADAVHDLCARRPSRVGLRADEFWAIRDVSFDVRRGESVGIMGLNGAGKSTLVKLILGSLRLTEGEIAVRGLAAALSDHGLGFDPVLSGRENVYMAAAVLGIARARVALAFDRIVDFSGLGTFIDAPVRAYSTGMRARLGFAVAMYLEPDILLVDEVLAVGDVGFQRQCIDHTRRYLEDGGSLLLVSHNPHVVQYMCDRCLVLDRGRLVFDGDVVGGVARYLEAARTSSTDPILADAAVAGAAAAAPHVASNTGVTIDDFGVSGLDGQAIRTGDLVRVQVRYRSVKDVAARWGFCLLSSNLETTIACEGPMQPVHIPVGRGELRGTVRLPLTGGRYALRVAIMDSRNELPLALGGFADAPRLFTVHMPTTLRNNYRMVTRDLIALDEPRWEHARDEPAPAVASSS